MITKMFTFYFLYFFFSPYGYGFDFIILNLPLNDLLNFPNYSNLQLYIQFINRKIVL